MQPFTIVPTKVVDKFLTDNAVKVNESNRYEQAYQLAVDYPDLPRPREIRLWLQALITNLSLTRSSTIWLSKIPNKADTILLLTYAGKLIDDIMSVDIGLIQSTLDYKAMQELTQAHPEIVQNLRMDKEFFVVYLRGYVVDPYALTLAQMKLKCKRQLFNVDNIMYGLIPISPGVVGRFEYNTYIPTYMPNSFHSLYGEYPIKLTGSMAPWVDGRVLNQYLLTLSEQGQVFLAKGTMQVLTHKFVTPALFIMAGTDRFFITTEDGRLYYWLPTDGEPQLTRQASFVTGNLVEAGKDYLITNKGEIVVFDTRAK